MSQSFVARILVAAALAAAIASACSSPRAADGVAKANPAGATTSSADGTLLSSQELAHDTISDRADAGRITGDPKATVWVVMASDFQCPFCKTWHDASFPSLLKGYVSSGRVRLAFLNMPLSMHPNAVPAAEAAMCASVQNKFWPMHEALFATQAKWETLKDPTSAFDTMVSGLGANMPAWRQCMSQHLTRPLIQADHDRASRTGANSTPTFFVGDRVLSGADADLKSAIEAALAKAGQKPGA